MLRERLQTVQEAASRQPSEELALLRDEDVEQNSGYRQFASPVLEFPNLPALP